MIAAQVQIGFCIGRVLAVLHGGGQLRVASAGAGSAEAGFFIQAAIETERVFVVGGVLAVEALAIGIVLEGLRCVG